MDYVMADSFPIDVVNFPEPPLKKTTDYLTDGYKSWAYSAIRLIANDASTVPVSLYKQLGDGEYDEIEDHPALDALRFVNEYATEQMLREGSVIYSRLIGEYAWLLLKTNNVPVSIILLRPDWIQVKPDGKGGVSKYVYKPGGSTRTVDISPEDLIFHKTFNPVNNYRGFGDLRAIATDIDIDDYSDTWNRNFFFNSAMPSFLLFIDKTMTEQQKKRFMEGMKRNFGGVNNAHKVGLIEGGGKVEKISEHIQEMDFQNSKNRLRDKILSTMHISKSNIGLTDDVNRANATAQETRYMKNVIVPEMVSFMGFLNEFYLPKFDNTDDLFFNFEDPVPSDRESDLRIYEVASKEGWMTTNEIRSEFLNLEPIEGGDVIYKPFSLQPVGGDVPIMPEVPEEEEEEEKPEEDEEENEQERGIISRIRGVFGKKTDQKTGFITLRARRPQRDSFRFGMRPPRVDSKRKRMERIYKELNHGIKSVMIELMKQSQDGNTTEKDESREALWKIFIAQAQPFEQKVSNKINKLATEQSATVLENLEKRATLVDRGTLTPSSILFSKKTEDKKWKESFKPLITRMVKSKGEEVLRDLSKKSVKLFDLRREEVLRYLNERGLVFIEEVNDYTRELLLAEIEEGLQNEEGIQKIARRIKDVYDGLKTYRAERIARTEVIKALNFGALEAYKQSGVVPKKQWLATQDERVRDAHAAVDGQMVDTDKPFTVNGEKLDFPGDPSGSAANIINCRCTTIPVTESMLRAVQVMREKEKQQKVEDLYPKVVERVITDMLEKELKSKTAQIKDKQERIKEIEAVAQETLEARSKEAAEELETKKKHIAKKERLAIAEERAIREDSLKELETKIRQADIRRIRANKEVVEAEDAVKDMLQSAKDQAADILDGAKSKGKTAYEAIVGEVRTLRDKMKKSLDERSEETS